MGKAMLMIVAAIIVSGAVATFTDWLFMGVLFHSAYTRFPEVWWPRGGNNTVAIIWSSVIGYLMSAGVVGLCVFSHADTVPRALTVALLAWLAGPLVILLVNGLFIKIDPKVTFAHCLGWFARMALAALAAAITLGPLHALS
jgi:hypothetical protein